MFVMLSIAVCSSKANPFTCNHQHEKRLPVWAGRLLIPDCYVS